MPASSACFQQRSTEQKLVRQELRVVDLLGSLLSSDPSFYDWKLFTECEGDGQCREGGDLTRRLFLEDLSIACKSTPSARHETPTKECMWLADGKQNKKMPADPHAISCALPE